MKSILIGAYVIPVDNILYVATAPDADEAGSSVNVILKSEGGGNVVLGVPNCTVSEVQHKIEGDAF